jgi:hypothetical protein
MKWTMIAVVGLFGFGCSAGYENETGSELDVTPAEALEYDDDGHPIVEDPAPQGHSAHAAAPATSSEGAGDSGESSEVGVVQQPLFGSDSCRDIDVEVTNSRWRNGGPTEIEVKYVKYFSYDDGQWRKEDIQNQVVDYGTRAWRYWGDQDLNSARDDRLTYWRVYYTYRDQGTNQWSSTVYQEVVPEDHFNQRCQRYWTYHLTVN